MADAAMPSEEEKARLERIDKVKKLVDGFELVTASKLLMDSLPPTATTFKLKLKAVQELHPELYPLTYAYVADLNKITVQDATLLVEQL